MSWTDPEMPVPGACPAIAEAGIDNKASIRRSLNENMISCFKGMGLSSGQYLHFWEVIADQDYMLPFLAYTHDYTLIVYHVNEDLRFNLIYLQTKEKGHLLG